MLKVIDKFNGKGVIEYGNMVFIERRTQCMMIETVYGNQWRVKKRFTIYELYQNVKFQDL